MRNKIFFLLMFSFTGHLTTNAQFSKGQKMYGASVGSLFFNSGSAEVSFPPPTNGYTSKTTNFGLAIQPSVGWFVSESTAIGITLNINPTNNKTSYEAGGNTFRKDESSSLNLGIGGFARNYFKSSSSLLPFGQLSLNMGVTSNTTEGFIFSSDVGGSYKETYSGKSSGGFFGNATLSLGVTKMLNPNTGLDFFAGYTYSYNKFSSNTNTLRDYGNNGSIDLDTRSQPSSKFTNHGFQIGVGFQVFLQGKSK